MTTDPAPHSPPRGLVDWENLIAGRWLFGAGLALALACDLRIAARGAILSTAFARVGLAGDYGGTWFLTRLVGSARARELYSKAADTAQSWSNDTAKAAALASRRCRCSTRGATSIDHRPVPQPTSMPAPPPGGNRCHGKIRK